MNSPREPYQPEDSFPTAKQADAVKLIDPLYTFMARSEIYGKDALILAQEQLTTNSPMDKIEEDFVTAADKYLSSLISEYDSE